MRPFEKCGLEPAEMMRKASRALISYLELFSKGAQDHWALGDAKGGYLCTNLGLRALLIVLRKLIDFVERQGVRADALDADEIIDLIKPYAAHVVQYFKEASPDDIARFRNRGSSLLSVSQNAFQMMAIIAEADPKFDDKEVREYLAKQDQAGTREARIMIDDIEDIIFNDIIQNLKSKYPGPGDLWWLAGIPKSVRNDADRRYNDDDGAHERWRYLMFIDYQAIVLHGENWDLFKEHYNFQGKGAKSTLVRWIGKVNAARTVTHHAAKGPLSHDQVDYVRRVYELVKKHIRDRVPVDGKTRLLFDDRTPAASEAA